jgi:ATP-dependent DNA ligase
MTSTATKTALMGAIKALNSMEASPGRLEKEAVLEQHEDNPILAQLFRMAIGGDRYHVLPSSNLVSAAPKNVDVVDRYNKFLELSSKLRNREITGAEASTTVDRFLTSLPSDLKKWITRVLLHDLRIGVSNRTITKVWGKEFWQTDEETERGWAFNGCQLAKKYEDVYKKNPVPFPVAVEIKLDGMRALVFAFPKKREVYIFSRGKKRQTHLEGVEEFREQVLCYAEALNGGSSRPVFLDGEFLAFDGVWNSTAKIVRKTKNFKAQEFLDQVGLVLFDFSPLDAYQSGQFNMSWKQRKHRMLAAAGLTKPTAKNTLVSPNLGVIGHKLIWDMASLTESYDAAIDAGWEGLMLKQLDAPHVFRDKRPKSIVKLKPEDEQTGIIEAVKSGKGKHDGANSNDVEKVRKKMSQWGEEDDDGYYLHIDTKHPEKALEELRELVNDTSDRRLSTHIEGRVSYRYSPRLGYFIVRYKKKRFRVGGGFTHKAGGDQRMEFWQRREELIGVKVDFVCQKDAQQVAEGRFNRFKRLREDL